MTIAEDDPCATDVQDLLRSHLAFANQHSPPQDVHALDVDGLLDSAITFFSARDDAGQLLAVGALKTLTASHAEIKSMHTSDSARSRGIGRAMLAHLLRIATGRGCRQVSLETGTMDAFAAARHLYTSAGFVACEPFASYIPSSNSVCMTLMLDV